MPGPDAIPPATAPPLLEARGITKLYPGVRALDDVGFTLASGEIHALVGENGAGKSSLISVLTGAVLPDAGTVRLGGAPIRPRSPSEAQRLGVSAVYQEVHLIPELSVAENVCLGRLPVRRGRVDWPRVRRRAADALARVGVEIDVTRSAGSYSVALQQMVAVARALDTSARVLVLDEPTSSLDRQEAQRLFDAMRRWRARGLGIVFISHFLDQIDAVADRITVLRNGRLVGTRSASALSRSELVGMMLGHDAGTTHHASPAAGVEGEYAREVLRVEGIGRRGVVESGDLVVRQGEVVGLAGLLGSGRSELAGLIFGLDRPERGTLVVHGRARRWRHPRDAIRRGIALLPENRRTQGVFSELTVRENVVIALQARRGWARQIWRAAQRRLADRAIAELRIATTGPEQRAGELSGGNQQKVMLARWLATEPAVLILDEPTRGIDIGAKAEVETLVERLRGAGMGVVFISSELDEVLRVAECVVVVRDRRTVGTLEGAAISMRRVLSLIAGEMP